jgi:putative tricarboxylic transport membrane protein
LPFVLSRRRFAPLSAASVTVGAISWRPAMALADWKPGRDVEIVVGTNPGTGFDRTARVLQSIWQQQHLLDVPVTVLNKPGGAGVLAWLYINQRNRAFDALTVIAPVLLTNYLTGRSTFTWHDLTPLCVLLGEDIMVGVPSASDIRNGRDFADALKRDPTSISVGMSGIGGQNHVTLGLIGKAAEADLSKLKVVGFDGSGEAMTAVVGGHVDAAVGPISSFGPMIASGRLRGIGVATEQRLGGTFANVPTWREQGLDVVFTNWRGIAGPGAMTPQQAGYWDALLGKTVRLQVWQDELARTNLSSRYLDSSATRDFMVKEEATLRPVLQQLGFAH